MKSKGKVACSKVLTMATPSYQLVGKALACDLSSKEYTLKSFAIDYDGILPAEGEVFRYGRWSIDSDEDRRTILLIIADYLLPDKFCRLLSLSLQRLT